MNLNSTPNKFDDDQMNIVEFLRRLAEPYIAMANYRLHEAIELFKKLPGQQKNSAWALYSIGKCLMDLVNYSEAETYFTKAHKKEPYRME
jgi:tetratricopeptide (TPR) repeat protein